MFRWRAPTKCGTNFVFFQSRPSLRCHAKSKFVSLGALGRPRCGEGRICNMETNPPRTLGVLSRGGCDEMHMLKVESEPSAFFPENMAKGSSAGFT